MEQLEILEILALMVSPEQLVILELMVRQELLD
jgi:hypothetical protein